MKVGDRVKLIDDSSVIGDSRSVYEYRDVFLGDIGTVTDISRPDSNYRQYCDVKFDNGETVYDMYLTRYEVISKDVVKDSPFKDVVDNPPFLVCDRCGHVQNSCDHVYEEDYLLQPREEFDKQCSQMVLILVSLFSLVAIFCASTCLWFFLK
jgi:hypothetical protein